PAKLELEARGEEILDFVVISILVLERQRRTMANSVKNHIDGIGVSVGFPRTAVCP
ncbi:hypothetical protein BDP27DRAFT_1223876, partial [Rhodocollybia butyracea]